MKACLMKVNYDPKYTMPHQTRPLDTFQGRLTLAREIYSTGERQLRQTLEEAVLQRKAKHAAHLAATGQEPVSPTRHDKHDKHEQSPKQQSPKHTSKQKKHDKAVSIC